MTIMYEVFTINIVYINEKFQYQDFIPLRYFNDREEAIEYCKQGNQNGHTKYYWREIIID